MQHRSPINDPNDQATRMRYIVAIVLSIFVIFGFHYTVEKPRQEAKRAYLEAAEKAEAERLEREAAEAAAMAELSQGEVEEVIVIPAERIDIDNGRVAGSFSTKGNRIDDLRLLDYMTEVDGDIPVTLFSPSDTEKPYYAEFGWISNVASVAVPDADTVWTRVGGQSLNQESDVTLVWNNGAGLEFQRTISLDENYMFTVSERVTNTSGAPVTLYPYQLLSRQGIPEDYLGFFILHEGPIAYINDELQELGYDDTFDAEEYTNVNDGWLGFTDRYWFTSLIPQEGSEFTGRFVSKGGDRKMTEGRHQADVRGGAVTVGVNDAQEISFQLFAGAKELDVLNGYAKQEWLKNINLSIDFGVLYLLTKPLYFILSTISAASGLVWVGLIGLTILLRLAMFPLTNKSFRSMAKMKKVAPQMKELQKQHKDDPKVMQMKLFELYQKEGVNPMSGCWPILLQIPIFFALYKVILLDIELRHAPFPGWIEDMSVQDPTTVFNLFGLFPYDVPSVMMIGAWPCLMGLSMIMQKRLNPKPADKTQAMVMTYMPYFMTIILAKFAAGLVIYWTTSNLIGMLQQYVIMRKMGVKVSLIKGHLGEDEDEIVEVDKDSDAAKDKDSK